MFKTKLQWYSSNIIIDIIGVIELGVNLDVLQMFIASKIIECSNFESSKETKFIHE